MTATATFQPHNKRLFVSRNGRRIGFHQLHTRKYADINAALATHGLTVDQGWKYLPGGEVYRAVLRAA